VTDRKTRHLPASADGRSLKRCVGLGLLTLYGVGVMVGAGIYVLIGAVVGVAGALTPHAFLLSGLVAALSAYSFAELAARIPESAGEAAYAQAAFGSRMFSLAVGVAVMAVGTISAAAILKGGVGYLLGLVDLPRLPTEFAVLLVLTTIAFVGVVESLTAAAILTVLEIGGLLIVAAAGLFGAGALPVAILPEAAAIPGPASAALLSGALLAFFAYVGFEDMVNMAEETVDPARTMPRAIFLAVGVTTALYMLVAIAALRTVPAAELALSERPLALVFSVGTGWSAEFIMAIAIVATLNGVLVQIVMVARVLYGLSRRRAWLAPIGTVNARLKTPVRATVIAGIAVGIFLIAAPIEQLAGMTSTILLAIFVVMNAALIVLKRRGPPPAGAPNAPLLVPVLGAASAAGLLLA